MKEVTGLRGEFKSTLDSKGRMNIPVKLREEFGASFVITKVTDKKGLKIISNPDWEDLVARIKADPETADFQRVLFGNAFDAEMDKQGRILIPEKFRKYAELEDDVVILALEGRAEIWNKKNWDEFNEDPAANYKDIAKRFGL